MQYRCGIPAAGSAPSSSSASLALFLQSLVTNPNFRWDVVGTYILDTKVIQGVGWTLLLTVASMVLAIVLAILLAFMRQSDNPVFRWSSWTWVWFFRGTPVYTQLVFWGLIAVLYPKIVAGVPFGPELFSVDTEHRHHGPVAGHPGPGPQRIRLPRRDLPGRPEVRGPAARWRPPRPWAWRKAKIMWRIILPQAMRVIVPPTGNETIGMLKTTSLVLAVPFTLDLTFATNALANRIYLPVPLLIVAAFWYLVITSILMVGQHFIEALLRQGRGQPGPGQRSTPPPPRLPQPWPRAPRPSRP